MPHRDPETGQFVGGGGGGGEVDYSSFEYEHHNVQATFDGPTGVGSGFARFIIDPLSDFGGLESDEVAELVALWYTVTIHDSGASGDEADDVRGDVTFGINLELEEVPAIGGAATDETADLFENDAGFDDDTGASVLQLRAVTEPGVLYHHSLKAQTATADTTNGTGEGGTTANIESERLYRLVTGRGPILDPTDDLVWWIRANIDAVGQDANVAVSQTAVWDTMEVTDKRSRFSVP